MIYVFSPPLNTNVKCIKKYIIGTTGLKKFQFWATTNINGKCLDLIADTKALTILWWPHSPRQKLKTNIGSCIHCLSCRYHLGRRLFATVPAIARMLSQIFVTFPSIQSRYILRALMAEAHSTLGHQLKHTQHQIIERQAHCPEVQR